MYVDPARRAASVGAGIEIRHASRSPEYGRDPELQRAHDGSRNRASSERPLRVRRFSGQRRHHRSPGSRCRSHYDPGPDGHHRLYRLRPTGGGLGKCQLCRRGIGDRLRFPLPDPRRRALYSGADAAARDYRAGADRGECPGSGRDGRRQRRNFAADHGRRIGSFGKGRAAIDSRGQLWNDEQHHIRRIRPQPAANSSPTTRPSPAAWARPRKRTD